MYEQPKRSFLEGLKAFFKEAARVFRVTKKPGKEEFTTILKVSALGVGVIGFIGFLVYMVVTLL